MNTARLKKIGDTIIHENMHRFDSGGEIDRDKINDAILRHVKVIPEDQRGMLALYIESKVDRAIDRVEKKVDEILKLAKGNRKDINHIKITVGCNGD